MESGATPGPAEGLLTFEELQLATRNRGMPLEALLYPVTPSGLHYLLVHFDIPAVDAANWRLRVGGLVRNRLKLSLDDIRALPRVSQVVTMECAGNGRARLEPRPLSQPWLVEAVSTAEWTGPTLSHVLDAAGLDPSAVELIFTGADRGIQGGNEHDYARSLLVADASRPEVMLAFEMNGRPLETQHGYPLRLVVPGWYGMTSVKWLTSIEAVAAPFDGYQQKDTYWLKTDADDPGSPIKRMYPRALMVPPGLPDFFSRQRIAQAGANSIRGRAWSGQAPVTGVEFGVDGEWAVAELEPALGEFAWRGWSAQWKAVPGDHILSCRATDAAGNVQPTVQRWNYQGMANNMVQLVPVTVR